jgi:phosphoglucomutase
LWADRENAKTAIPSFTYTPVHGVGLPFAQSGFEAFGFPKEKFSIVAEQAQPDPTFPTVKFPNPEEKGERSLLRVSPTEG